MVDTVGTARFTPPHTDKCSQGKWAGGKWEVVRWAPGWMWLGLVLSLQLIVVLSVTQFHPSAGWCKTHRAPWFNVSNYVCVYHLQSHICCHVSFTILSFSFLCSSVATVVGGLA